MSIVQKQIDAMLRGMLREKLITWDDFKVVARSSQYEEFKQLDGEDILYTWFDKEVIGLEGVARGMQFLYGTTRDSKPEPVAVTQPTSAVEPKKSTPRPKLTVAPIKSVDEYVPVLGSRSSGRRPIPVESQKRIAALRLEDYSDTAISRITGIPAATVTRYRERTGHPNGSKRLEVGGYTPFQEPKPENPESQPEVEVEELQLEEATPSLPVVEDESSDFVQSVLEESDDEEGND